MKSTHLAALALVGSASASAGTALQPLVAPLKDQTSIYGCSWSAESPATGPGFVFLGEIDDSMVLMNIGGRDVPLRLDREKGTLRRRGDVLERVFRAPGIEVVGGFKATWTCPAADESCEVTRFKVEFRVSEGKRVQVVRGIGDVGC